VTVLSDEPLIITQCSQVPGLRPGRVQASSTRLNATGIALYRQHVSVFWVTTFTVDKTAHRRPLNVGHSGKHQYR